MGIAENLERIRERIARAAARAGRRPEEVTLVGVAKTFPAECIREAYSAGVRHFGENRVQEWEGKQTLLSDLDGAVWHLVGHLQGNKARRAAALFHSIDSVDSVALAQKLDRADKTQNTNAEGAEAQRSQKKLRVLIEVRLAPEETKHGVEPNALPALAEAVAALPHLNLRGLMCIPPFFDDPERARPYFRRLRELRDALPQQLRGHSEGAASGRPHQAGDRATEESRFSVLSMGMSHDFEVAIEEGATEVRIGTALFGPRP